MPELCGCFGASKSHATTQVAADPDAGFARQSDSQQPPQYDSVDAGYTPVVPLPQYTARPMILHEKTLENNPHRPRPGSFSLTDEKNRQSFEAPPPPIQPNSTGSSSVTLTATMDDASSAYSFPSSFGHTSTETRDTPPPPYSSCASSMFSRSRASSMRSHYRNSISSIHYPQLEHQPTGADSIATITPPPMAHVNRPSAVFVPAAFHQHRRSRDSR